MISVIIPVYNVEEYLHDCIFSVLNQTYDDFEVICIDDCSTDSSFQILKDFEKIDTRIKVFKNEVNSSLGFTRNRGLEIAKGKYVLFLDSDDWLDFNTLEILHDVAEKNILDVLIFKAINFDDEQILYYKDDYYNMKVMNPYLNKVFNYYDLTAKEIFGMAVSAWIKLYNRSFLIDNKLEFPAGLIHEDNPFFFEMLYKAQRVSIIDNYMYNRRRRANSITTFHGKEVLDVIKIIELCLTFALNNDEIYEKYKKDILNKIFYRIKNKYDFIEDAYKNEFIIESKEFLLNMFSKFEYLEKDFQECLFSSNLNFYKFILSK